MGAAGAIAATIWAGCLVVLGLWLVFSVAPRWSMFGALAMLGGLTAVVMGQFVFSLLVADRLFPGAARIIGWRLEIGSILLLLAVFGWTAWVVLWGGRPVPPA
jgi:hypothetical protein